jgi:sterol 14-demethylase
MWFLTVAEDAVGASDAISLSSILMFAVTALVVAYVISFFVSNASKKGQPPRMPSYLPFVGNIVGFGQHPVKFIQDGAKKVGIYI